METYCHGLSGCMNVLLGCRSIFHTTLITLLCNAIKTEYSDVKLFWLQSSKYVAEIGFTLRWEEYSILTISLMSCVTWFEIEFLLKPFCQLLECSKWFAWMCLPQHMIWCCGSLKSKVSIRRSKGWSSDPQASHCRARQIYLTGIFIPDIISMLYGLICECCCVTLGLSFHRKCFI